jgi:hypothetical protein
MTISKQMAKGQSLLFMLCWSETGRYQHRVEFSEKTHWTILRALKRGVIFTHFTVTCKVQTTVHPTTDTISALFPWDLSFYSVPPIYLWLYSPCGPWPLFQFHQPVARSLPTHRSTQRQNKRTQISMPQVGFEPSIPAFERAKTVHALDRVATVIGFLVCAGRPNIQGHVDVFGTMMHKDYRFLQCDAA